MTGKFKTGDHVQLNLGTGGPVMIVGRFDPKKGWECCWNSVKGEVKYRFFLEETLKPAEGDGRPPKIVLTWATDAEAERKRMRAEIEKAREAFAAGDQKEGMARLNAALDEPEGSEQP